MDCNINIMVDIVKGFCHSNIVVSLEFVITFTYLCISECFDSFTEWNELGMTPPVLLCIFGYLVKNILIIDLVSLTIAITCS